MLGVIIALVASLGMPVVLVYLGFLGAEEMHDLGEPLLNEKVQGQ
jgi:hypothetical protein